MLIDSMTYTRIGKYTSQYGYDQHRKRGPDWTSEREVRRR
jgi:hypothetical protein